MSEIKLLPCPFCGGGAQIEEHSFWNEVTQCFDIKTYGVNCHGCLSGSSQFHRQKEEAIKQWNTRKPMENMVEEITFLEHVSINDVPYINMNDAMEIVKEEGGIE